LRPSRYKLTEDGIFSLGSEVGTIEFDEAKIVEKGRLGPGQMVAIDTAEGRLLHDTEIKERLADEHPYGEWLKTHLIPLAQHCGTIPSEPAGPLDILTLTQKQLGFGYSSEELEMILKPMVQNAAEAVGSMGDDTPLAILSLQPRLLYTYFKKLCYLIVIFFHYFLLKRYLANYQLQQLFYLWLLSLDKLLVHFYLGIDSLQLI